MLGWGLAGKASADHGSAIPLRFLPFAQRREGRGWRVRKKRNAHAFTNQKRKSDIATKAQRIKLRRTRDDGDGFLPVGFKRFFFHRWKHWRDIIEAELYSAVR